MNENFCPKCGRTMSNVLFNMTSSTVMGLQCLYCSSSMKEFEVFLKCLSVAYREFCLNKIIHSKINGEHYKKFQQQWDTIILALELDYKIWLAKILEKNYTHECLKNYKFSPEYQPIVDKIENWRNDFGAHFNSNTLINWKNFTENNPLSIESADKIFNKIIDLIDEYDRKKNLGINPRKQFSSIYDEAINQFNDYLETITRKKFNIISHLFGKLNIFKPF